MVVYIVVCLTHRRQKLLKESMDSKISNCKYFNKDSAPAGPITSFVRYCVEILHRVGEVVCKENHI